MHRNILWSGLLRMGSSVCLNEHNFGWQSSLLIDMNKNVTLVGEPILHGLHLAVAWALPPPRVSERKFTLSLHCVRVVGNTTGCALQHVEHSSFRFLWVLHIPIMIPNRNMSVQGMINTVHQISLIFLFLLIFTEPLNPGGVVSSALNFVYTLEIFKHHLNGDFSDYFERTQIKDRDLINMVHSAVTLIILLI